MDRVVWIPLKRSRLGLSIYANFDILKKNLVPVLGGCLVGAATSVASGPSRLARHTGASARATPA